MRKLHRIKWLALVCLWALPACGSGAGTNPPVVDLFGELSHLRVTGMEYLVDEDRSLFLEQARSASHRWRPDHSTASAFGFTDAVCWLRFRVANPDQRETSVFVVIDNEYLDRLDLYGFVRSLAGDALDDDAWERSAPLSFQKTAGREYAFYAREVPNRKFAFPLNLPAGEEYALYIAARSRNPMSVPVSIMSQGKYTESRGVEQLRMGIYAGFFALLFAGTLALYSFFRDRILLIYLAYLFLNFLYQFSLQGYAFQYLWPTRPLFATSFTTLMSCCAALMALVFARQFLETRRRLPGFDRILRALMALPAVTLALLLFAGADSADRFNSLLVIPGFIIASQAAGVLVLLQGFRPARFYLVAWGAYSISLIILILQIYAILPNYLMGVEMLEGLAIGTSIEMLFFPFAIADRIRLQYSGDPRPRPVDSDSDSKLPAESVSASESPRPVSRISHLDRDRVQGDLREAMEERALYREKLSLRELADQLAISEKELSEFLNEVLGQSFHDYVNGFRIREACGLLRADSQRKIVDIAFAVGFSSLSTFHNAFQKSQGLSPRRYRENVDAVSDVVSQ